MPVIARCLRWLSRHLAATVALAGVTVLIVAVLIPGGAGASVPAAPPSSPPPSASPNPSPSPTSPPTTAPPGSASPSTSPSQAPPGGTPPADPNGHDSGGCGWFDVACKVKSAINGWFKDLVKSAINPVFGMLGKTLLATPQLDHFGRVRELWMGSAVVANSCFVLLVLAGGLILMGHQSVQTSYALKDIAPRLVVGMVLANTSLLLVGMAISLANGLAQGLLGQGVDPGQVAGQLQKILLHAIHPLDVGIFVVLVAIWGVILGLILLLSYIIRVMLTILLIVAAPLALACHALPQTEGLARLWWRALAGVLAIQVAQALVFITAMKVLLTTDMITWFGLRTPGDQADLWIVVCLLYILMRIPSWISKMIWRGGLSSSPIVRAARTIAAIVIFKGTLGTMGASRAAAGKAVPRRPPGPTQPTQPRVLPPGPLPPPSGPQPRWAPRGQRWTPPDPHWHARVSHDRPDADSVDQQHRWGNPATTWTPPYAGNWRKPPPPPPRRPPPTPPSRPDPNRPWTPPDPNLRPPPPRSAPPPPKPAPRQPPPPRPQPRPDPSDRGRPWQRPT